MSKIIRPNILTRLPKYPELMAKLGKSTKTHGRSARLKVNRWIRDNKPDGPLTTMARLDLISQYLKTPIQNIVKNETNKIRTGELPPTG